MHCIHSVIWNNATGKWTAWNLIQVESRREKDFCYPKLLKMQQQKKPNSPQQLKRWHAAKKKSEKQEKESPHSLII